MIRLFIFALPFLLFCQACDRKIEPPKDKSIARISCEGDPQTLDPRLARDLASTTFLHLLYEGLTRTNPDGETVPALAESITPNSTHTSYTFKLRPSTWSDGLPLTAYDFEQSWKSMLDPEFASPNASQLFVIKGAQAAKENKASLDKVGIYPIDAHTLLIELEQPTPHFPGLLATHFFYPVHPSLREKKESDTPAYLITNGPFVLEGWARNNQLSVLSNTLYWDAPSVKLDKIIFIMLDNPTALQLYKNGELEWTGSPLSTLPTDALASLKKEEQLQIVPAAGLYFFRLNTAKPPFDDIKLRQAFALALNRQDLVEHVLKGNQLPATRLVPPSFLHNGNFYADADISLASQLYRQAAKNNELTTPLTICYATGERAHKIAQVAQHQWKEALGVEIRLQACESKLFYERLKNNDYQLAIGSWFADYHDPLAFLEVFKYKNNGTNNTGWENEQFIALLNRSSALDKTERHACLAAAENLLISEMPVIPLFHSSYSFLKNPGIKGVYFSELGYIDLKHAFLEK
ncbi:MAG: peptide ABC transporter substrate-binding protein [Parachlamydia sp.]|jgi:oligopeptide transport system substrate-binding protein|nr:peptide ABC transporter substrate-binding protein [Parachlamydia sp.]